MRMIEIQTITHILGYVGGSLIVLSYLPQLFKIIETKKSQDVALGTFVILFIAQIFWITYGILRINIEIIVTNTASCILTVLTIIFGFYYRK